MPRSAAGSRQPVWRHGNGGALPRSTAVSRDNEAVSEILVGKGEQPVHLLAKYGNRHGLVAGATGTGKTVSLLVLAEGFSRIGVPVFIADVKGDVAGAAMAGTPSDAIRERAARIG